MEKSRIRDGSDGKKSDPGWKKVGTGIRDGKKSEPGSGMENSRIRDPEWKKVGTGIWDGKKSDPGWKQVGSGINTEGTTDAPDRRPGEENA